MRLFFDPVLLHAAAKTYEIFTAAAPTTALLVPTGGDKSADQSATGQSHVGARVWGPSACDRRRTDAVSLLA